MCIPCSYWCCFIISKSGCPVGLSTIHRISLNLTCCEISHNHHNLYLFFPYACEIHHQKDNCGWLETPRKSTGTTHLHLSGRQGSGSSREAVSVGALLRQWMDDFAQPMVSQVEIWASHGDFPSTRSCFVWKCLGKNMEKPKPNCMVYDHFLSEIGNFDVHRTFGQT